MVSNPVLLRPSCLQANVGEAERAIARIPTPQSAVILIANAESRPDDPARYLYTCWILVNSTIVYSCRFTDQASLDTFVTTVRGRLDVTISPRSVLTANAIASASHLPCPPPDDATARSLAAATQRAALSPT